VLFRNDKKRPEIGRVQKDQKGISLNTKKRESSLGKRSAAMLVLRRCVKEALGTVKRRI